MILDLVDRDQRYPQVTHLLEQPVQRGLVGHGAGEKCVAVLFQGGQSVVKPVGPVRAQVTPEPDLIDRGWPGPVAGSGWFDMAFGVWCDMTLYLCWPVRAG